MGTCPKDIFSFLHNLITSFLLEGEDSFWQKLTVHVVRTKVFSTASVAIKTGIPHHQKPR